MRTFFITANDTDAGKTYVCGLLARHFAQQGLTVQIVKAVECGGSCDAANAQNVANSDRATSYTLFDYPAPLAPLASENKENGSPRLDEIIKKIESLPLADIRIIEGAGGVAVPITDKGEDWRDFVELLCPDFLVAVIENRLGAINQSRMLNAYLEGLQPLFILSDTQPVDPAVNQSNLEALEEFKLPILARVEHSAVEFMSWNATLLDPAKSGKSKQRANPQLQALELRRAKNQFRTLKARSADSQILNLAENDYLNLKQNPAVVTAAQQALESWGTSAAASPLISGYTDAHAKLETQISAWHGKRPSLLWNSGYAANQAILKLFIQSTDLVLADRLIHNSLITGILNTGARLIRFKHNDLGHLERLLRQHTGRKIHVVTESVYSMDGDYPDLQKMANLRDVYGFQWFLDEAHAVGWYGASGAGLAEAAGVLEAVDLLTGTLGKALASGGAYTVFNHSWMRDYCINEAGEFIYSTYFPPSSAVAASAAIELTQGLAEERRSWQRDAQQLRLDIQQLGFETLGDDSPIIPVIYGESAATLEAAEFLKARGIQVGAIRPPTVPNGQARLRISLKSSVDATDRARLLQALNELKGTQNG